MFVRFCPLAVYLALAGSAGAVFGLEVGEKAPELQVSKWYNLPGGMKKLSVGDLKGQIVLATFWTTWDDVSDRSIPLLGRLSSEYKRKGVVILGVTEDGKSKVVPFMERNKVEFIMGQEGRPSMREYGITEVPSSFLIDPDGKVAWKGHPAVAEEELKKLLKEKPPKKGGMFSEKSASAALKEADRLFKNKKYIDSIAAFEQITLDYKGTKAATKAKDQIKKMKGNSTIMEVVRKAEAERKSKGWLECARLLAQYGEKKDAIRYYDRIIKEYPGYEPAKLARQERASLTGGEAESKDTDSDSEKDKKPGKAAEEEDEEEDEEEGGDEEESEDGEEEEDGD